MAQDLLFKHKIEIEEELLSAIAYACVAELTQKIIKKEINDLVGEENNQVNIHSFNRGLLKVLPTKMINFKKISY